MNNLNSVLIEGTVVRKPKENRPNGSLLTFKVDCTRDGKTIRVPCTIARMLGERVKLTDGMAVRVVGRLDVGMVLYVEHVEAAPALRMERTDVK
jgi:hypothetical protein